MSSCFKPENGLVLKQTRGGVSLITLLDLTQQEKDNNNKKYDVVW